MLLCHAAAMRLHVITGAALRPSEGDSRPSIDFAIFDSLVTKALITVNTVNIRS